MRDRPPFVVEGEAGEEPDVFAHPFVDPSGEAAPRVGISHNPSNVYNDPVSADALDEMASRHGV